MAGEREREQGFAELHAAIRNHYLAEPDNPYRGSGRSSGAARWEESRRILEHAIDRDGSFLDLGCANGLLLETLADWVAERGITLSLHGVDFVAELVDWARRRLEGREAHIHHANAWDWRPPHRYDYVRTSLECFREQDRIAHLQAIRVRMLEADGRVIACWYRNADEPEWDVAGTLRDAGFEVAGQASVRGAAVAWTKRDGIGAALTSPTRL